MSNRPMRVDYDQIAHLYDEPFRDYPIDPNLLGYMHERSHVPPPDIRVLDMGCGTGKQITADRHGLPDVFLCGMDRSKGMLHYAQKRCDSVTWLQGDSSNPPFRASSFDYITNQLSYHHVADREGLIRETFRLLRADGRFALSTIDPWQMSGWRVYQYFPAAEVADKHDFLPIDTLTALMQDSGFSDISVESRPQVSTYTLSQFRDYASKRQRTSQLMAISDSDYAAGIAQIHKDIRRDGPDAQKESVLCFVIILGNKH
jgi:SAM-dependent methyltransferase